MLGKSPTPELHIGSPLPIPKLLLLSFHTLLHIFWTYHLFSWHFHHLVKPHMSAVLPLVLWEKLISLSCFLTVIFCCILYIYILTKNVTQNCLSDNQESQGVHMLAMFWWTVEIGWTGDYLLRNFLKNTPSCVHC